MSFATPEIHHYAVEVLTEQYLFSATLEPPGMLLNYVNHPDRATLQLKQVTATALDASLSDLFDTMTSYWAPATDALVYPLMPCATPVFSNAQLLLLNRRRLLFYQPVKD